MNKIPRSVGVNLLKRGILVIKCYVLVAVYR